MLSHNGASTGILGVSGIGGGGIGGIGGAGNCSDGAMGNSTFIGTIDGEDSQQPGSSAHWVGQLYCARGVK